LSSKKNVEPEAWARPGAAARPMMPVMSTSRRSMSNLVATGVFWMAGRNATAVGAKRARRRERRMMVDGGC